MLPVIFRKKREITKIWRKDGALYLESESGIIRIWPQTDRIVRVSYTENGVFDAKQGEHLEDLSDGLCWEFEENAENVRIVTQCLTVKVSKAFGSVMFFDAKGMPLLKERNEESKIVEEFDSYKMVVNENTKVEKIQTVDGEKSQIKHADRVFDKKLFRTRLHLEFDKEESLFGLGQAEEGVWNLRNTTQYVHQANLKIAVPMVVSSKGYGILLSSLSPVIFSDTQYGTYLHTEADEYLDYYFIWGDGLDGVIDGFRKLSGKAVMLPKWAFGYMQSQERYESAKEIVEVVDAFREHGFPLDTIILDWISWKEGHWGQKSFDESRFPDPTKMMDEIHERNAHFMMSIWPNMNPITDNYQEFLEKGLLLSATDLYDPFRAEGRALYWEQVNRALFKHNVDGWWCDSSEPITPEWMRRWKPEPGENYRDFLESAKNCMPIEKSNVFCTYHAQTLYEGQRSVREDKRVVNLTRSGHVGSQKYGTILWSGDTYASWETLRKQVVAGLQFCASGLPYWTLDIGAFFIKKGDFWYWNGEYNDANEDLGYCELYTRWFQYGAFLPIFRSHGTDCRREPWYFDKGDGMFYDALLKAANLRYELMPYIYSLAGSVWNENQTILRMMAFDFAYDKEAVSISDQYMFGPSLMVCPVLEPMYYQAGSVPVEAKPKTRMVYMPAGTSWYNYYTNEKYEGGQYYEVSADIDRIPLFVKAGGIIPTAEPRSNTAVMEGCDILLKVYGGADGSFTLYEDAGDGYGYENGEYCLTDITYKEATGKVEWNTLGDERYRKGLIRVENIYS